MWLIFFLWQIKQGKRNLLVIREERYCIPPSFFLISLFSCYLLRLHLCPPHPSSSLPITYPPICLHSVCLRRWKKRNIPQLSGKCSDLLSISFPAPVGCAIYSLRQMDICFGRRLARVKSRLAFYYFRNEIRHLTLWQVKTIAFGRTLPFKDLGENFIVVSFCDGVPSLVVVECLRKLGVMASRWYKKCLMMLIWPRVRYPYVQSFVSTGL